MHKINKKRERSPCFSFLHKVLVLWWPVSYKNTVTCIVQEHGDLYYTRTRWPVSYKNTVTCILQKHSDLYRTRTQWPVSYKNTHSNTFSINFSVNSSASPYCLPDKSFSETQMPTACCDVDRSATSARLLFDRDDATLNNEVQTPSRHGHRSLHAALSVWPNPMTLHLRGTENKGRTCVLKIV
jgi:hypothetical protein